MKTGIDCGAASRRTRLCTLVFAMVAQVGFGGAWAQSQTGTPPATATSPAELVKQLQQQQTGQQGQAQPAAAPQAASNPQIQEFELADDPVDRLRAEAYPGDGRRSVAPMIPSKIKLYSGEAVVRRTPGAIRRVAVGNGEIVSVFTVGKGEVVVIGTAPGNTNVHLWMTNGSQRDIAVEVTGIKGDHVAETVRLLLGDVPGLVVRPVGSNIVVTGADLDDGTAARLAALQKSFPEILNFTGTDPVGMQPMVMMDVQIMEFNKDSVEDLGIRWDSVISGPIGGLIKDVKTNDYFRLFPEGEEWMEEARDNLPSRLTRSAGYFGIATSIASSINLMMQRGQGWILASPKLSAKSGSNATFLVGGEVPIVIPSILGQSQVEYKEYGIRLNITPSVNARNQVATSIMAEVSRIDPAVAVQGIPGFLTRRVETEINVHAGETIVISGLLDTSAAKAVDKIPLLGDIPILGKLFRSDRFEGGKTELVIFVTPRIVSPTSPNNLEELRRSDEIRNRLQSEISPRQRTLIEEPNVPRQQLDPRQPYSQPQQPQQPQPTPQP